jgi:GH18 family chitinase
MVSYDDAQVRYCLSCFLSLQLIDSWFNQSFAAKGKFIKSTGLRGFAMWEAGGDYDNILVNAIRRGGGF